jgi:hypothetical protein
MNYLGAAVLILAHIVGWFLFTFLVVRFLLKRRISLSVLAGVFIGIPICMSRAVLCYYEPTTKPPPEGVSMLGFFWLFGPYLLSILVLLWFLAERPQSNNKV